ncbi:hypothetical protein KEM56_006259 [Ascosphaera pollenicola]|nr:hypothetical protein KEM56_006259 [Ascosphaera pollenicola]
MENDMRINSPHMLGVPLSLPPRPLPFAAPPRPGIESLLTSSIPSSPRPFSTKRRPSASHDYLVQSFGEPTLLPAPRPLLVILDLNGTLLHRKKKTNRATCRPYLHPFINSLISSHRSMIWTSTMPANTMTTVTSVFNKYTLNKFVDVWARDRLRLREWEYNNKVQVYKNLEWVWEDKNVQGSSDSSDWDQKNTVLVDDSRVKAASHPFNLIEIPEFDGKVVSFFDEGKALLIVLRQLRVLSWYADVSTKIREWDELRETKFPLSEDEEDDLDLDDIEREAKLKSQSPEEREEEGIRRIARRYDMEDFWDGVLDAEEKKLELEPLVFEGQQSPAPKPVVVEEQKGNGGKSDSRKKKREAARLAAKKEKNAIKREERKAVAKAGAGR